MEKPVISIVIPVKNGSKTIAKCLDAIKIQTLFRQTEVVIIDSGSTDSTLVALKEYPFVRLYKIKSRDFNHGETRNYGVSLAKGEIVIFTVQDAVPVNNDWLSKFVKCFNKSDADAVCGRQIVPPSLNYNPAVWFNPISKLKYKEVFFEDETKLQQLSAIEKRELMGWDDVNAAYKKTILEELPFPKTMFAEDLLWCKKALSSRKKIVFDHSIQVAHFHYESFKARFKRVLIEGIFDFNVFELKGYNNFSIKKLLYLLWNLNKNIDSLHLKIKWSLYNIKMFLAHNLAKLYLSFLIVFDKLFKNDVLSAKITQIQQPIGGND